MRTPKSEIDKRYEEKHKEERKAAHAVWGTSMKREDFEKLNKFLKDNHKIGRASCRERVCQLV